MGVRTKRVYEPPSSSDGRRYLVDRLWPRGIRRSDIRLTEWLRDLAPSQGLRVWFAHDPRRFVTFRRRYLRELADHTALLDRIAEEAAHGDVTLLFAARDPAHCNVAVLRELLEERLEAGGGAHVPAPGTRPGRPRGGDGSRRRPSTAPARSKGGSKRRHRRRARIAPADDRSDREVGSRGCVLVRELSRSRREPRGMELPARRGHARQ
ncbi:MAG: DUF488 family protein [Thermoplasmata archaeon]